MHVIIFGETDEAERQREGVTRGENKEIKYVKSSPLLYIVCNVNIISTYFATALNERSVRHYLYVLGTSLL